MIELQKKKLEKLKSERDNVAVKQALEDLRKCAETKEGNLLDLSIKVRYNILHWYCKFGISFSQLMFPLIIPPVPVGL